MDLLSYLLSKLSEEASELSQAACKAQQNGLDSFNPKEKDTGENIITKEANDVLGIMSMICKVAALRDPKAKPLFAGFNDPRALDAKERKVIHYALYPYQKGILQLTEQEAIWLDSVRKEIDPSEFK